MQDKLVRQLQAIATDDLSQVKTLSSVVVCFT